MPARAARLLLALPAIASADLAAAPVLLALALAGPASAQVPSAPVAAAPAALGAKAWIGRYGEIEEYLRTGSIESIKELPTGVSKPRRAFFVAGGPVKSAAVKDLPPGRHGGFWDTYKSEIAAYQVDRLLGLDMVPVTVERRVGDRLASVQMWVEGCRLVRDVDQSACPRPLEWAKQACRQRVFDNLVANIDRNAGNMLVDDAWNIVLIDHSRAFGTDTMPFLKQMTRIDREMLERIKALDEAGLMKSVRPWVLDDGTIRGVLKRRDRIVAHFEALARERGEAAVFPF